MRKIIYLSVILFTATISFAQNNYSIEFNYGLISPLTRTNGLQGAGKINYQLDKNIRIYATIGYGIWGAEKIHYKTSSSGFNTLVSSENHKLIPVHFGTHLLLKESNFLDLFATAEIGFSFFSYLKHNHNSFIDPNTKEIVYYPSDKPNKEVSDFLLGIGIGLGGSHKISKNTELHLQLKINTNYTTKTKNPFDTNVTYTSLIMGFNYFL